MVDMNALERQLADESLRIVGAPRPVDDLAVYESVIAANRQRGLGFTMLSALKFVAAGVIVALFGGFLLAGVLTTQQDGEVPPAAVTESPSPMTTEDPLAGMVTEEVEPGVFRVVNDGVRDLAKANNLDIVAGHDDGIWLLRPQRFVRLGGDDWHGWATRTPRGVNDFEVAPDGTVWAALESDDEIEGGLYSVARDSDEWTLTTVDPYRFEVTSEGTLWELRGHDGGGGIFGHSGEDGWQPVGEYPSSGGYHTLLVSDRGEVWAVRTSNTSKVRRFVDGEWLMVDRLDPPDGRYLIGWGHGAAVGADGTFWGHNNGGFFRFDGSGWMAFEGPDWMPTDVRAWRLVEDEWAPLSGAEWRAARDGGVDSAELISEGLGWGEPHVAPDGSLWVSARLGPPQPDEGQLVCDRGIDGVANFDGVTWSRFLQGRCVQEMDIAADGSVWLLATESGSRARNPLIHTYVITPEAVQ